MAERSIGVRLRAEVGEFKRALGEGVKTLKETQAEAAKAGSAVDDARSKMASASKRAEAAERQFAKAQKDSSKTAAQKEAAERKLQSALDAQAKATAAVVQAEARHKASLEQVARAQATATTASGRAAQSIKDNIDAYQTAGGVLAAAGAATTALTASVLKTGVAYNGLQQTSRAALTTMLGSSEAVNAQMAELDKFARTSPFSKQTFITAQQQMLAFGVETEKVVPYLSAINDATAAAGGNSQTLGELAFVMAQISAAGKITGQDLIQFGQRGVNAAELIGSQMGKTGAQIRQDITDGTLSADVALDALAAGMSAKFEGASANVKNTFGGAVDRIKAAWRDLAAEMAEPLVSAEGGGMLVDAANGLADILRWAQALPDPLKLAVGGMTALTGAAGTVTGATLLMLPRLIETKKALDAIKLSAPGASKALGLVGKSAGVAGVALAAYFTAEGVRTWENNAGTVKAGAEEMADAFALLVEKGDASKLDALLSGGGSWSDFTKKSKDQANAIDGLADAIGRYKAANDEANSGGSSWFGNESGKDILGGTAAWNQAVKSMEAFDAAIAAVVESGDPEALAAAQKFLADAAAESGLTIDQVAGAMPLYSAALKAAGAETAEVGVDVLQAAKDAEEAQKHLQASYEAFVELYGGAAAAFIDLGGAYDAVIEKNKALAQSTADATEDSKDSWEDYYDGVSVSMGDYIAELEAQAQAQAEWKDNLVSLAGRVSDETLASLAELGPGGASLVADLVGASERELDKLDMATAAKTETDAFISELLAAQGRIPELDVHTSVTGYENVYGKLQAIQAQIRAINGTKARVAMGPGGQGGTTFATGGGVSGPGTGTSDSIPAMLSNGEHVWTADDVAKAGGQGAMYRARGLVQAGLLRFAVGGAVGSAESSVERERKAVLAARAAVKAAKKSKSDKDDKAAQKRLDAAEDRLDKARARLDRLRSERSEFSTDVRRGSIRDSVTSGLSGGLSVVDRALSLANSGDLTKKQSAALRKVAGEAEKSLTMQYGLLEKQNEKIKEQESLLSDVKSMHDSISGSIMGQVRLTDLLGQKTPWGHDAPVTPGAIRAYVADKLSKATKFSGQLEALRQRGAPDALLQEVLSGGIEGGSALASALLSAGDGDWSAITGDWRALESVSSRIGDTATRSKFGTTASEAQATLDAYQAGADQITGAIDRLALGLQSAIGAPLRRAGGGAISGPGSSTSDSILTRLSDGEYVVNAASYAANAGLVQAINASSGPVAAPMVAMPSMVSTADIVAALTGMAVMVQVGLDRQTQGQIVLNGSREAGRTDAAAIRHNLGVRS